MKKLCTYLTLFVLSLLCLAQPAAADVTVYFRNTANWTEPSIHWFRFDGVSESLSPQAMEKLAGTDNVYFKKLEGATIKDHATDKSQASGIIFTSAPTWEGVTRYDYEAAPTKVKDGYIYDAYGNSEPYTAEEQPSLVNYTIYFEYPSEWGDGYKPAGFNFWDFGDNAVLHGANGTTVTNKGYLEMTLVRDNIYKIEITGADATKKGKFCFKGKGALDNWDKEIKDETNGLVNDHIYKWSNGSLTHEVYIESDPVVPFVVGTSVVHINGQNINGTSTGDMAYANNLYSFGPFQITSDADFSIWYGDNKDDARYHLANTSGAGFTLGVEEENATAVKFGATATYKLKLTQKTKGSIIFDAKNMKVWFEEAGVPPTITATPESGTTFENDIKVTLSADPSSAKIYYTTDGSTPSVNSTPYTGEITLTATTTLKVIAYHKTAQSEATFTYTKETPRPAQAYIAAQYIKGSDDNWGGLVKEMEWNAEKSCYTYYVEPKLNNYFMVSLASNVWDGRYEGINGGTFAIPTSKPDNANIKKGGDISLTYTEAGTICFDPTNNKVWLEPKSSRPAQPYIAAESYGNLGLNTTWGDNVQKMTWNEELGVYSAPVRKATDFMVSLNKNDFWSGRYVFNNGTDNAGQVPTGEPQAANIKLFGKKDGGGNFSTPGAGTIYFDPEGLKLWYDPKVTEFFEQGKTYYVNVEQYPKWNSANLGYKFSENGALNTGYVEIPNEVFSFTNTEAILKEVILGRKVGSDFFSPLTVQAPTDGSNMIYLKADESGNLVFDRWGTYDAPAHEHLYILGEWLGSDYQGQQPVRMDYNANTGIYSYYVPQDCNLALSLGSTNAEFWGDKGLQHIRSHQYNVIHMAEPAYNNLKAGNNNGKNTLKLFCPSTVYARYDVTTDPANPVMRVWCTPDEGKWPDLYIMGAIIAEPNEEVKYKRDENGNLTFSDDGKVQKEEDSKQWNTIRKLEKDPNQPGLYTYMLTKDLVDGVVYFNTKDYWADKNKDGVSINEIGHFNFSFMSANNKEVFWTDPFCPATGGMGFIDRDGTPEPFVYRGHDPDREGDNWVGTNFVFAEEAKVFVDVVRQLVWVELKNEKKATDVVFHFWDKGGEKYPEASNPDYRWWNDRNNMNCELYIPGTNIKTTVINSGNKNTQYVETMSQGAYRDQEQKDAGMKYKFVLTSLPSDFTVAAPEGTTEDFPTATLKDNIWVRITKGDDATKKIERPYVYDAIYTQGPKDDVNYNNYGKIEKISDPVVTMIPGVNVIHSRVKVPEHPGRYQKDQMIIYPYLNQFFANVRVYQDYLPFYMEGITEATQAPIIGDDGNQVEDRNKNKMFGYPLKEGKEDFFKKFNHAVLEYGTIREIREGSSGVGLIKGLDFANAKEKDNLSIKVTYMSEGMIFDRSKVMMLSEYKDRGELPNLQTSEEHDVYVKFFNGSSEHIGDNGEVSSENHVALDAILDIKFAFRKNMREERAAYIGFKVEFGNGCHANDDVTEANKYLADNGHPLVWKFWEDDVQEHSVDNWHYEAFYDNHLAVQLHHIVHGKTNDDLKKIEEAKGTITYHMIVPVATDFSFTTGEAATMSQSRARVAGLNGEEKAPTDVKGDPSNPYVGKVSAGSHYSFSKSFAFYGKDYVPTGVESVGVEDADAPVEFYNLQGIRMNQESLAPGIYIRRQGNKASKVYVR